MYFQRFQCHGMQTIHQAPRKPVCLLHVSDTCLFDHKEKIPPQGMKQKHGRGVYLSPDIQTDKRYTNSRKSNSSRTPQPRKWLLKSKNTSTQNLTTHNEYVYRIPKHYGIPVGVVELLKIWYVCRHQQLCQIRW